MVEVELVTEEWRWRRKVVQGFEGVFKENSKHTAAVSIEPLQNFVKTEVPYQFAQRVSLPLIRWISSSFTMRPLLYTNPQKERRKSMAVKIPHKSVTFVTVLFRIVKTF